MTMLAVLLVMGGALVIATSLLFAAQAQLAALSASTDAAQSRALAWSGVQAVMLRLDGARGEILEGRLPRLDEQLTIYENAGRLGVARLEPIGPAGERLVSESAKLDLESATAPELAATGLVDEPLAEAVLERRAALNRPWQSVGELLSVPGMTAEILWGTGSDAAKGDPRGLADVVTVFSFEPAIQRSGALRINLNVPWSQALADRVAERFGDQASETLKRVVDAGTTFESDARIVQVLNFFQVPVEDWPDILDAFTTEAGEFHFGRMDINSAPYEALLALPGLGPERAAEIVQVREELSGDERATIAWPALRKIVEGPDFEMLAGRITTRSWTYRVRLAAGEVPADDPDGPLRAAVTWEAGIDLSSPRPRVAYLRDVTWLDQTTAVAAAIEPEEADVPDDREDSEEPVAPAEPDEPDSSAPAQGQPPRDEGVSPGGESSPPLPSAPADPEGAPPARNRIGRWTAG
jgi:DNA uptake protein ComE-like DNA-binding protein